MKAMQSNTLAVSREVQNWPTADGKGREVVVYSITPAKGTNSYTMYRDSLGRLNLCPSDNRKRARHVGSTHFFDTVEAAEASRKRLSGLAVMVEALEA